MLDYNISVLRGQVPGTVIARETLLHQPLHQEVGPDCVPAGPSMPAPSPRCEQLPLTVSVKGGVEGMAPLLTDVSNAARASMTTTPAQWAAHMALPVGRPIPALAHIPA